MLVNDPEGHNGHDTRRIGDADNPIEDTDSERRTLSEVLTEDGGAA